MKALAVGAAIGLLLALRSPESAFADGDAAVRTAASLVHEARTAEGDDPTRLANRAVDALESDPATRGWQWLSEPLRETPADLQRAAARLDAAQAIGAGGTSSPDSADVQSLLASVFADPRFHRTDAAVSLPGWLLPAVLLVERLLGLAWNVARWPFDRLLDLLEAVLSGPLVVALWLVLAVALASLYRFGIRAVLVRQAEALASTGNAKLTDAQALVSAHECATEGRYRDACHFLLLSALLFVEEHERVRFDPSATNREHLRHARSAVRPAIARALGPLVNGFDSLWYGAAEVTETDYHDLLMLTGALREAAA
ncbi:MAG TPA: DUF4129 domain-containing protein [Chloroflexota bacterium]|nr:DUF4129 domain-containing protein [Chloroflexota bacterium]